MYDAYTYTFSTWSPWLTICTDKLAISTQESARISLLTLFGMRKLNQELWSRVEDTCFYLQQKLSERKNITLRQSMTCTTEPRPVLTVAHLNRMNHWKHSWAEAIGVARLVWVVVTVATCSTQSSYTALVQLFFYFIQLDLKLHLLIDLPLSALLNNHLLTSMLTRFWLWEAWAYSRVLSSKRCLLVDNNYKFTRHCMLNQNNNY